MSVVKNPTLCAGMLGWLLLFGCELQAQTLTIEEHERKLRDLSLEEKVDYLIENSYSLYSSDYDRALELMREGRDMARRNSWKDKEAYFDMFVGVILYLKGDFENALASGFRPLCNRPDRPQY